MEAGKPKVCREEKAGRLETQRRANAVIQVQKPSAGRAEFLFVWREVMEVNLLFYSGFLLIG